jgi:8-oxo-dGTP pyrophosphatase MutT (NUDIX family)
MTITRDMTVAVLVVRRDRVLLHWHAKLGRWLPPGGHIEPNELPDEAAQREVIEETGVDIELVGDGLNAIDELGQPRQLCRPMGVQLADISPGHQHIDLVYLARGLSDGNAEAHWASSDDLAALELTTEVGSWCEIALDRLGEGKQSTSS